MASGVIPSKETSSSVRALVSELGVTAASERLGIGREATSRIAAGFGVRRGTLFLAMKKLAIKPNA